MLAPLGNILLRYCLSEGLVNDWWSFASRRTTVEALHSRWKRGTSLKSAATSVSSFDKISAAKILVAATFAVNPLLQRASRPFNKIMVWELPIPFQLATTQSSFEDVGFRSVSMSSYAAMGQLSPPMVRVMRDYTNRSPIINQFWQCPGNCTGSVRAAGFHSRCSTTTNDTYQIVHSDRPGIQVVFETDTIVGSGFEAQATTPLALYAFFAQTTLSNNTSLPATSRNCSGIATTVVCNLTHAVLEYPIVLRDNVITVDTRPSAVTVVQTDSDWGTGGRENALNLTDLELGFNFAVEGIIRSEVTMFAVEDDDGWSYHSTGPFPDFYMQNTDDNNNITCAIASTDPTDDILTTFNEIMFRSH